MPPRSEKEVEGLQELKKLRTEFLEKSDENELVKQYLKDTDDEVLLNFLRGRKYRVEYAWETLKRNAEVKKHKFPDMFPDELPASLAPLRDRPIVHVLKHLDSHGRRVIVFDPSRWNPDEHSLVDISKVAISLYEKLTNDDDAVNNGIIVISDCGGYTMKHCMSYSVKNIRKLLYIFWHAYPIRYKGVYYLNTPYMLSYALSLCRVFFPKKLKERFYTWTASQGYDELHKFVRPEILPAIAGGTLSDEDAYDEQFY